MDQKKLAHGLVPHFPAQTQAQLHPFPLDNLWEEEYPQRKALAEMATVELEHLQLDQDSWEGVQLLAKSQTAAQQKAALQVPFVGQLPAHQWALVRSFPPARKSHQAFDLHCQIFHLPHFENPKQDLSQTVAHNPQAHHHG